MNPPAPAETSARFILRMLLRRFLNLYQVLNAARPPPVSQIPRASTRLKGLRPPRGLAAMAITNVASARRGQLAAADVRPQCLEQLVDEGIGAPRSMRLLISQCSASSTPKLSRSPTDRACAHRQRQPRAISPRKKTVSDQRAMAGDREMVFFLGEIARLALAMRDALSAGDLDSFGALLAEHWAINKRMDPGCTNPFIDELFETLRPYICGGKLAGAAEAGS